MGSGPTGDAEGVWRVSAWRGGARRVMRAKDVLDEAAVYAYISQDALFGVNEETLATDWTPDVCGELR